MADYLPARRGSSPVRTRQSTTGPPVYYSYNYNNTYEPGSSRGGYYGGQPDRGGGPGRFRRGSGWISQHSGTIQNYTSVPSGVPRFLGSRPLLLVSWFTCMILIGSNEWNLGFHFPRPARLWYASLVFFGLFLVSQIDAMVPICNALGIGFAVELGYENVSGNTLTLFGHSLSGGNPTSSGGGATGGSLGNGTQVSGSTGSTSKAGGLPRT